jgi:hypothetical protein
MTNVILDAFRRRFGHNPEVNELTPFGFFEAGWRARPMDSTVIEVGREQLAYWGAAVTLAESFMSLVYFRGGIHEWDTPATPAKERWHKAIAETEQASRQIAALLDAPKAS